MANYYKTYLLNDNVTNITAPIYSSTVGAGIITTTIFGSAQTSYVSATNNIPNNTSYTSAFLNTINEKPITLNYSIGGVDLSNNSIAYWIDGSSNIGVSIPSWATKIRAVLVGAGGQGGASTQQQHVDNNIQNNQNHNSHQVNNGDSNQDNVEDNTGFNGTNDNNDQVQHNNSPGNGDNHNIHNHNNTIQAHNHVFKGGGSGGGGGFIYLSDYALVPSQIQIVCGSTGATVLTIGGNVLTAGAGFSASGITLGAGGTTTIQAATAQTNTNNGGAGQNGPQNQSGSFATGGQSGIITYSTSITNGRGGSGGAATTTTQPGGTQGNSGYYRIYFLTN